MFQRILVPLDGSVRAEHAIPVAARLARASRGTIVFIHTVLPPLEFGEFGAEDESMAVPPTVYEKRVTKAEQYLRQIVHTYENDLAGIHVEQEVEAGATAATIFSVARLEHIDLMVLCSHGAHDLFHWIFRSIAREAVHHGPVPMLVLRETGNLVLTSSQTQPLRMLVPLDGSQRAEAVLQPALQLVTSLAAPGQGEVHLTRVVDLPSIKGKSLLQARALKDAQEQAIQEAEEYLREVTQRLSAALPEETRPAITWSTRVGNHVARTIADMVNPLEGQGQEHGYDLLAMATHGRTGLQLLRLGSVTEHVLGATDLPLLVVRPPKRTRQQTPEGEAREKVER